MKVSACRTASIKVGWTDVAGILETVDNLAGQGRGQLGLCTSRGFPSQRSVRVRHNLYGRSCVVMQGSSGVCYGGLKIEAGSRSSHDAAEL
jgi:hypothetical protein